MTVYLLQCSKASALTPKQIEAVKRELFSPRTNSQAGVSIKTLIIHRAIKLGIIQTHHLSRYEDAYRKKHLREDFWLKPSLPSLRRGFSKARMMDADAFWNLLEYPAFEREFNQLVARLETLFQLGEAFGANLLGFHHLSTLANNYLKILTSEESFDFILAAIPEEDFLGVNERNFILALPEGFINHFVGKLLLTGRFTGHSLEESYSFVEELRAYYSNHSPSLDSSRLVDQWLEQLRKRPFLIFDFHFIRQLPDTEGVCAHASLMGKAISELVIWSIGHAENTCQK